MLLSFERVFAFGSEVLNVLYMCFKEYDFFFVVVCCVFYLFMIIYFMIELLSVVLLLFVKDLSEFCVDGDESDDEYGDVID